LLTKSDANLFFTIAARSEQYNRKVFQHQRRLADVGRHKPYRGWYVESKTRSRSA
jgi:hypothetical protein